MASWTGHAGERRSGSAREILFARGVSRARCCCSLEASCHACHSCLRRGRRGPARASDTLEAARTRQGPAPAAVCRRTGVGGASPGSQSPRHAPPARLMCRPESTACQRTRRRRCCWSDWQRDKQRSERHDRHLPAGTLDACESPVARCRTWPSRAVALNEQVWLKLGPSSSKRTRSDRQTAGIIDWSVLDCLARTDQQNQERYGNLLEAAGGRK